MSLGSRPLVSLCACLVAGLGPSWARVGPLGATTMNPTVSDTCHFTFRSTMLAHGRPHLSPRTIPPGLPITSPMVMSDVPLDENLQLPGVDGAVVAVAQSGNTLYLAGSFRSVGNNTGGGIIIDSRDAALAPRFPKVDGGVNKVISDGRGGWYIGGAFTAVGGIARSSLAHILPDGSVADWAPTVSGDVGYEIPPTITAMALSNNRLYVGGEFKSIGLFPRHNLACVDATTGDVLDWNPITDDGGYVLALAVHGDIVFVGGLFTSINGQPRSYLGAIDAMKGTPTPWRNDATNYVTSLAVQDDTLFIGGYFRVIGNQVRPMVAAVNAVTGEVLPFFSDDGGETLSPDPPAVFGLALDGTTLYAVGNFTHLGGGSRSGIAALNTTTGSATAWVAAAPGPGDRPPPCTMVAVRGDEVFVGGWFGTMGGLSRPGLAVLRKDTGSVTTLNAKANGPVNSVAFGGTSTYVGGDFEMVGDLEHRAGLAAIDLANGHVKPWDPNPDGLIVSAMALGPGRVYVSGDFANIGGNPKPRRYFAALDTLNGEALDWNPNADNGAAALLFDGGAVYAGGYFTQISGHARSYVACLDGETGLPTSWDPSADWPVFALARSGNTLYVGGIFDFFGSLPRRGIAAVDAKSGMVADWNPRLDNGWVKCILAADSLVYVGGTFSHIGGQARQGLAAIDNRSGAATEWNPSPEAWHVHSPGINALALGDSGIWVGGDFATIGGGSQIGLACVSKRTGLAGGQAPDPDGIVWTLAQGLGGIVVGGGFGRLGGWPSGGVGLIRAEGTGQTPIPGTVITRVWPNPGHGVVSLACRFSSIGRGTLEVFDLAGRRILAKSAEVSSVRAVHEFRFETTGWRPGVYLCRVSTNGADAAGKKLMVF